MRPGLRWALPFLLCSHLAVGQTDFRISGYAVTFPFYERLNPFLATLSGSPRNQFVDITRIRLRPSVDLWSSAFLMIEYEANATYFSSPPPFASTPHNNPRQVFDLTWNPVSGDHWSILHYVDRLYVRQSTTIGEFTLGRQRISWGTGRVWNPTDLFNPLNPLSFSKIEKDGVDAMLAKFRLGNFSDLSLVFNAKERFKKNNYGMRLRSNVAGYDFSVMGGSFDGRTIVGADFAGNIFDAGFRGEAVLSAKKEGSNVVKYILGMDNQFTPELYALVEYHFNGEGKTEAFAYELQKLILGDILNLGKQYLAIQTTILLHPLVAVTGFSTHSFTDGSGFAAGTVSYSASDEMTVALGGQYFYGDEFDEYWYYPASLYCRIDYFF